MEQVVCVILGGGRGTRLRPLTTERAKPAVPLAGKYRLIDIPVSNCLNSGLNRIYVLTQFNTASLHRHIAHTYKFDDFSAGMVETLAAEQTADSSEWYQGTADAVRQNLSHLRLEQADLCLILSGDQLYRMDFREMIRQHKDTGAAVTIAAKPVTRAAAHSLGVIQIDQQHRILGFHEKPDDEAVLDRFAMPQQASAPGHGAEALTHLASMGIYLFDVEALTNALQSSNADDFGKQVIPEAMGCLHNSVYAHLFDGYWEDIGTIEAFFEANLALTAPVPPFNLFDEDAPVYTHPRYLPPSKLNGCDAEGVVIGDGTVIDSSRLRKCVIGLRSVIRPGCDLEEVVMMGADFFETDAHRKRHASEGLPPIGLGSNVRVRRAIIDKNARIGYGTVIENRAGVTEIDTDTYSIRDGIVIVPRSSVIPAGTVI